MFFVGLYSVVVRRYFTRIFNVVGSCCVEEFFGDANESRSRFQRPKRPVPVGVSVVHMNFRVAESLGSTLLLVVSQTAEWLFARATVLVPGHSQNRPA